MKQARQTMVAVVVVLLLMLIGCQKQTPGPVASSEQTGAKTVEVGKQMDFVLKSTDIQDGQPIAQQFTGDGADDSPQLSWDNVPEGTVELALIVEDPDAPNGDFVHWVVYNIPPSLNGIAQGLPPAHKPDEQVPFAQGRNDFGKVGYKGPAPPPGKVHHYHFRLMALNRKVDLPPNADKRELRDAVKGHVIAEAKLTGTYQR